MTPTFNMQKLVSDQTIQNHSKTIHSLLSKGKFDAVQTDLKSAVTSIYKTMNVEPEWNVEIEKSDFSLVKTRLIDGHSAFILFRRDESTTEVRSWLRRIALDPSYVELISVEEKSSGLVPFVFWIFMTEDRMEFGDFANNSETREGIYERSNEYRVIRQLLRVLTGLDYLERTTESGHSFMERNFAWIHPFALMSIPFVFGLVPIVDFFANLSRDRFLVCSLGMPLGIALWIIVGSILFGILYSLFLRTVLQYVFEETACDRMISRDSNFSLAVFGPFLLLLGILVLASYFPWIVWIRDNLSLSLTFTTLFVLVASIVEDRVTLRTPPWKGARMAFKAALTTVNLKQKAKRLNSGLDLYSQYLTKKLGVAITDTAKSAMFSATVLSEDADSDILTTLYVARKDTENHFARHLSKQLHMTDRKIVEPRSLKGTLKAHSTNLLHLAVFLISAAALYLEYIRLAATSR